MGRAGECGSCGFPGLRPEGHADWCWTAKGAPYPFSPRATSWSKLPADEICEAYKAGNGSLATLATRYKVAPETIRRVLLSNRVAIRTRGGRPKTLHGESAYIRAIRLWDNGWGVQAIANSVGLPLPLVQATLIGAGRLDDPGNGS